MNKRALTLVELLVSLAIVAVIGSVVLVAFSLVERRRLETAARNLMADFWSIRQMAVTRHQNYTVNFDKANDTYTITDGSGNIVKPTQRLQVDITTTCPDTLTFQSPQGKPSTDNIIRLEHQGRRREITVYAQTGNVECSSSTIIP